MTPKLVTDSDIYDYLEMDPTEDDPNGTIPRIRDAVEDLLSRETGRAFGPAVAIVNEQIDGNDGSTIMVSRKIASIDNISFVYFPNEAPQNIDITGYVTFRVGRRRISSRGIAFPMGYDNILISYQAMADQPETAKQAVREAVATLHRTRGSEDARSEQQGAFQHVLKRKLDESLFWSAAVSALTVPHIG